MDADLNFESCVTVFIVDSEVGWMNERDGLVRFFGAEDVAE